MFAVIALSPICFRDLVVPPPPVKISFSYNNCAIANDDKTAHAGGFQNCVQVGVQTQTSMISKPFTWNTQCPSTILEIYGPIYLLLFAYGIIGSAVSLFQTSNAFKRLMIWNEARKARKAAAAAAKNMNEQAE